jgi:hypothetical protein
VTTEGTEGNLAATVVADSYSRIGRSGLAPGSIARPSLRGLGACAAAALVKVTWLAPRSVTLDVIITMREPMEHDDQSRSRLAA